MNTQKLARRELDILKGYVRQIDKTEITAVETTVNEFDPGEVVT